jgi:1-deoxy-D-xylulose-5-phosphate synthase
VLLVPVGPLAGAAVEAASRLGRRGRSVTVVDPRWLQPLDEALVAAAAAYDLVVTVEDGAPSGGFGDALARALRAHHPDSGARLRTLALPERAFVPAGARGDLLAAAGLDADGIERAVMHA